PRRMGTPGLSRVASPVPGYRLATLSIRVRQDPRRATTSQGAGLYRETFPERNFPASTGRSVPNAFRDQLQQALGTAYTLEHELGGGGMSHVFVATESALGRRVVVKVLPPDMAGSISVERFKREIAVAARLQHAHI